MKTTLNALALATVCALAAPALAASHAAPPAPTSLHGNGLHLNALSMNGLRANGLHLNGLAANGLRANGLHLNGLHLNGLGLNGFWFCEYCDLTDGDTFGPQSAPEGRIRDSECAGQHLHRLAKSALLK